MITSNDCIAQVETDLQQDEVISIETQEQDATAELGPEGVLQTTQADQPQDIEKDNLYAGLLGVV